MSEHIRADGRSPRQLRPVRFTPGIAPHATGSVLVEWGSTRVICAVTVEESVPKWMQAQKVPGGWLTAEYSMLPYSTLERKPRDISRLKLDGRSQEIQRLIGRSLRAGLDLVAFGARTAWVDCDVLQADGGTRTAAITGAYVALAHAVARLQSEGRLSSSPLANQVAAVSVGIHQGIPLLDLAYVEDRDASVDLNLVMDSGGRFVEVQASGEEATFSGGELDSMLALGRDGIGRLLELQRVAMSAARA